MTGITSVGKCDSALESEWVLASRRCAYVGLVKHSTGITTNGNILVQKKQRKQGRRSRPCRNSLASYIQSRL